MKKWSGGVLIIGLALILIVSYSFMGKRPQKQSAYDFFNYHSTNDSNVKASNGPNTAHTGIDKLKTTEKRPHLINFEGLADLYTSNNVSREDSKALLVWAQMRPLLSRSDALPETAQGIKEAAIAWKELLSKFEEDRASKFDNMSVDSPTRDFKDCPYLVSAFNGTLSRNGSILEIPCGLVDDSSITMIGIPHGQLGSFQIQLIGSPSLEEPKEAIILNYYVCLPGENLTKEPVIVQNTWTNEDGWGKEERCPNHGSAKTEKGIFCPLSWLVFVSAWY